jgi:Domain of unknown function (DUF4872)/Butirosin biosynthesis protein H, N-terminal
MTSQKHLKSRVRARMARTGESYASARSHVVDAETRPSGTGSVDRGTPGHGIHAETTAIRLLAESAGVSLSEELALVVGGGIGAGAFVFHYPEFSSVYLAGRNAFDDNTRFVRSGLERLGLTVDVAETSGAAAARRNLEAALAHGPATVWCDFVTLGTRGLPLDMAGGGYHVVVVRSIDDTAGTATIEDLRPAEAIGLSQLSNARARIAKDRNRVLSVSGRGRAPDLEAALLAGLAATVDGLRNPRSSQFGLGSFERLADRFSLTRGRDAAVTVFPQGRRLWVALRSIYEFVEVYGTGGGLMRPMFARGLASVPGTTGRRLSALSGAYAAIGREWSALAAAALPETSPLFGETRALLDERVARFRAGAASDELQALSERLERLADEADRAWPSSETDTVDLLALAERLRAIVAAEREALDELEAAIQG